MNGTDWKWTNVIWATFILLFYHKAPPEEILQLLKARPHYVMVANRFRRVPYDTAMIYYHLSDEDKDTRDYILRLILRTMDSVTRELPAGERQAFKKTKHYKELLDRNWSCRKGAILLATSRCLSGWRCSSRSYLPYLFLLLHAP